MVPADHGTERRPLGEVTRAVEPAVTIPGAATAGIGDSPTVQTVLVMTRHVETSRLDAVIPSATLTGSATTRSGATGVEKNHQGASGVETTFVKEIAPSVTSVPVATGQVRKTHVATHAATTIKVATGVPGEIRNPATQINHAVGTTNAPMMAAAVTPPGVVATTAATTRSVVNGRAETTVPAPTSVVQIVPSAVGQIARTGAVMTARGATDLTTGVVTNVRVGSMTAPIGDATTEIPARRETTLDQAGSPGTVLRARDRVVTGATATASAHDRRGTTRALGPAEMTSALVAGAPIPEARMSAGAMTVLAAMIVHLRGVGLRSVDLVGGATTVAQLGAATFGSTGVGTKPKGQSSIVRA